MRLSLTHPFGHFPASPGKKKTTDVAFTGKGKPTSQVLPGVLDDIKALIKRRIIVPFSAQRTYGFAVYQCETDRDGRQWPGKEIGRVLIGDKLNDKDSITVSMWSLDKFKGGMPAPRYRVHFDTQNQMKELIEGVQANVEAYQAEDEIRDFLTDILIDSRLPLDSPHRKLIIRHVNENRYR